MIRAYGKAFRSTDDVSLIIKTFKNPHTEIFSLLKELQINDPEYPNILVIDSDYSDERLKSLYEQCDALVAPSRAEGFGLPMAEAMLSNLAVITTGWSGQTDFCKPENSWLIDYSFSPANTHFNLPCSVWAEPDENHLAELMKEVYKQEKHIRDIKIERGKECLTKKFYWSNTAEKMIAAAEGFSECTERKPLRIGFISTWNIRCGIATYSKHLVKEIDENIAILAAHSSSKISKDSANVCRCWRESEQETLEELSHIINSQNLNTLIIQFNYGFFNMKSLNNFICEQVSLNRTVVIELHSTVDPDNTPHKQLSLIVNALKKCQRILVHSHHDMNRLKRLGIIENVAIFPHGIIEFESSTEITYSRNKPFQLATYGFFLPHKGLLQIIDAVKILHDDNIDIRLLMLNSRHPDPISIETIRKAKKKINQLGMNDVITLNTNFIEDFECLKQLSESDLIIYPYQETGESASGAVRQGIASGSTVAVTPLPIFEELRGAVHYLPGTSVKSMASGIKQLITDMSENDENDKDKYLYSKRWREECSYRRVAQRLKGLLEALQNH